MNEHRELSILAADFKDTINRVRTLMKKVQKLPVRQNLQPYVEQVEKQFKIDESTYEEYVVTLYDTDAYMDLEYIKEVANFLYVRIINFSEIEYFFEKVIEDHS